MLFNWVNVATPFSWCFVAAIFLGAAVARITRRGLGAARWTIVYVYLTVAVAMALGGVFVPGPDKFLDIHLALFSVAGAAVGYLAFRYPVPFGTPLVLLAAVALTILGISLRGWAPLHGGTEAIGRVKVLAAAGNRVDLELATVESSNERPESVTGSLPFGDILPIVRVARFAKYYFFVASPVLYRLEGVATSPHPDAAGQLALGGRKNAGAQILAMLPGVGYDQVVGSGTRPLPLNDYDVELTFESSGPPRARIVPSSS